PLTIVYLTIISYHSGRNHCLGFAAMLHPIEHFQQLDQLDIFSGDLIGDHAANLDKFRPKKKTNTKSRNCSLKPVEVIRTTSSNIVTISSRDTQKTSITISSTK